MSVLAGDECVCASTSPGAAVCNPKQRRRWLETQRAVSWDSPHRGNRVRRPTCSSVTPHHVCSKPCYSYSILKTPPPPQHPWVHLRLEAMSVSALPAWESACWARVQASEICTPHHYTDLFLLHYYAIINNISAPLTALTPVVTGGKQLQHSNMHLLNSHCNKHADVLLWQILLLKSQAWLFLNFHTTFYDKNYDDGGDGGDLFTSEENSL